MATRLGHQAAHPRELLVELDLVARVAQGVHDRVVHGRRLGEDDRDFRREGRDHLVLAEQTAQADGGVGHPGHQEEHHGDGDDLRRLDLLPLLLVLLGRLRTHSVAHLAHVLGLFADATHDVDVGVDNDSHGHQERAHMHAHVEGDVVDVTRDVVVGARDVEAVWAVLAPTEEGRDGPEQGPSPDHGDIDERALV